MSLYTDYFNQQTPTYDPLAEMGQQPMPSSFIPQLQPEPVKVVSEGTDIGKVHRFRTVGDGSCGFHALLGKDRGNGVYRCKAGKERAIFAVEIRKQKDNAELSQSIREELKDIFLHQERAPVEMKYDSNLDYDWDQQLKLYKDIRADKNIMASVKNEILDDIVGRFIDSSIGHYLKHVINTESPITPDELCALAETKGKVVNLFTKMQNEGSSGLPEQLNPGGHEPVTIFLSDTDNHYERAWYRSTQQNDGPSQAHYDHF